MIWAALGEGFLSMMIGYLMSWFTNNMLFYMITLMIIVLIVSLHYIKKLYCQ